MSVSIVTERRRSRIAAPRDRSRSPLHVDKITPPPSATGRALAVSPGSACSRRGCDAASSGAARFARRADGDHLRIDDVRQPNSSYCGISSVIVNHGALDPTKMCAAGRIVNERPQRHVDERAVAHDRVKERATGAAAMGVAGVGVTVEHELLLAFGDPHSSRRVRRTRDVTTASSPDMKRRPPSAPRPTKPPGIGDGTTVDGRNAGTEDGERRPLHVPRCRSQRMQAGRRRGGPAPRRRP